MKFSREDLLRYFPLSFIRINIFRVALGITKHDLSSMKYHFKFVTDYFTTRNTIHYKTPRHILFDKIICEHFYELVITIAL